MSESIHTNNEPRTSLRKRLFQPVDTGILAYIRIVVGLGMFFWAMSYTKLVQYDQEWLPLYDPVFMKPRFLFKYAGFEWVKLWPGNGMYWHFLVTKIAAIGLAIGLFTRVSGVVLCGSVAYVLLVERQIYLNHYYLLSCISGMLAFLPSARRWSVDALIGIERVQLVMPRWQFWLVRFQLGMPYVFGAIAKMNWDWLQGQPGGTMLSERANVIPLVNEFLQVPGASLIFSYGGLLYDLLVVPMLLYRRTRWLAILMSLGFHITNSQFFYIGVFPWFMLATLILFFPPNVIPNIVRWISSKYSDRPISFGEAKQQVSNLLSDACASNPSVLAFSGRGFGAKFGMVLAAAYVVIQLLLPVRPWVLPGNPSWNERGQRFAWRMMLRHKVCLTTFRVESPKGGYLFFPSTIVMTPYQSSRAERNPELLRQAAVRLKQEAGELGIEVARIQCLALVSLNGRRPVPLVDPAIDLTQCERGWIYDSWVNQKVGVLPKKPWKHYRNREEWWRQLVLPPLFKELQNRRPSELEAGVQAEGEAIRASQRESNDAPGRSVLDK